MKEAFDTASIDSATVVKAISAKIAYSLAAIESFGRFTNGPPARATTVPKRL
jgi:hypothetical protein